MAFALPPKKAVTTRKHNKKLYFLENIKSRLLIFIISRFSGMDTLSRVGVRYLCQNVLPSLWNGVFYKGKQMLLSDLGLHYLLKPVFRKLRVVFVLIEFFNTLLNNR